LTIHRVSSRRRARLGLAAAAVGLTAVVCMLALGAATVSAAPAELLPDLSMTRPSSLRIQTSGGSRLLRMSTTIVNIGRGPFETRASRRSTSVPTMHVSQRIYNTAGGTRVNETTEIARYAGDGHNHWHVQHVAVYELYAATGAGPVLRRDSKVGYCFFDTNAYRLSLPGAPRSRQYVQSGCGTKSSLFVKNGISVGWSDVYPWNIGLQWINVTGLSGGEYLLKLSANPNGQFEEISTSNNCNWTRIRIPNSGSTVRVVESGSGCALPGNPPPAPTPIPTGKVIIPPRPPADTQGDEVSVTDSSIGFICRVPIASEA
jgi:hypothetical protein